MAPKEKTIEDRYKKLTQIEHVLVRPDTYVGSLKPESSSVYVWDSAEERMVYKPITYSPGLYKIFDEILVNAADVKARQDNEQIAVKQKITSIKVDIDQEQSLIRVWNNGDGIPVEVHREHKVYVPELIFGQLLTSDNYDDNEERVTGGRNGYGAKLTNILSSRFSVECADSKRKKKIKVTWSNNMGEKSEPVIKSYDGPDFVCVTFKPDLTRFFTEGFTDDLISLFAKRVYDIAGTTGLNVKLNGQSLGITSFHKYTDLYFPKRTDASDSIRESRDSFVDSDSDDSDVRTVSTKTPKKNEKNDKNDVYLGPDGLQIVKIHDKSVRFEIVVSQSESGSMQQVSFVNNICTIKGGSHVKYISDQIVDQVLKKINTKNKGGMNATGKMVESHLWIFVNCLVINPIFDGQTKERLKQDPKTFGVTYTIPQGVLKRICNSPIIEAVLLWVQQKQQVDVTRKMNASKGNNKRIIGIPKLEDANDAGGKNSHLCTLILTEGDSAKTSCIAGLSVVGRDRYGVFPLRGKVLNVRDAKHELLVQNTEIKNIMQILGLRMGQKDSNFQDLRYGKLMIMTDQDPDGSHIKGLLLNFIQVFWPDLVRANRFVYEFVTPIVKCTRNGHVLPFFTVSEFTQWKRENDDGRGWKIKYYKGLGTSTDSEFKGYFSDLNKHIVKFKYQDQQDFESFDMAFSGKRANDRKEWILNCDPENDFIDHNRDEILYREFINKDLVHFSRYAVERAIPSALDGFKPGMRKCLFAAIKKKIFKNEIRITQLCGHILEVAAYHHGEAALQETIIKMAQRFPGANNIACFDPIGQFGSRKEGGKDASAPRYIATKVSKLSRVVFQDQDEPVLSVQLEDGLIIEPVFFMPVLPMILVNGGEGIGTGWSSSVPQFNPRDIIDNCRRYMNDIPMEPMTPWYYGYKGLIRRTEKSFESLGTIHVKHEPTEQEPWAVLEVTELPVKMWTQDFKDLLESMLVDNNGPSASVEVAVKAKAKPKGKAKGKAKSKAAAKVSNVVKQKSKLIQIQEYKDSSSHIDVKFEIILDRENYDNAVLLDLEKEFRLKKSIAMSNMMLFDRNGKIKKYETDLEILKDFCPVRLEYYEMRKAYILARLEKEAAILSNKARFVKEVVESTLKVSKRPKKDIVVELRSKGYDNLNALNEVQKKRNAQINPRNAKKLEERVESVDEEENQEPVAESVTDYDYLLGMAISSLTLERYEALLKEVQDKFDDLDDLRSKTSADLWDKDLVALEQALDEQEVLDAKTNQESRLFDKKRTSIIKPTNAKKLGAITSRKTPLKAAGGKKVTASASKKKKVVDSDDEDSFICNSDESDKFMENLPPTPMKPPAPTKRQLPKKEVKKEAPPKPAVSSPALGLAARIAQIKSMKNDMEDDDIFAGLSDDSQPTQDDIFGTSLPVPKRAQTVYVPPAGKPPVRPTPVRKNTATKATPDSSEDEEEEEEEVGNLVSDEEETQGESESEDDLFSEE